MLVRYRYFIGEYTIDLFFQMSGIAIPSFMSCLIDEYDQAGEPDSEHEEDIKGVGTIIYSGKQDTEIISVLYLH